MKYGDWLQIWIENTVKPTAKLRTYVRYKEIAEGHLTPKLGDCELNDVTPLRLQRFATELLQGGNLRTGQGLSVNSVNSIISVAQSSLKAAFAFGELETYTADRIKRPRLREKEIMCFSLAEQRAIEREILDNKKVKLFGVILCLYTGLRIGELLALTWDDVDLVAGTLRISKSCYYGKGQSGTFERHVESPKTPTSYREIPLPKSMLALLKAAKKHSKSEYFVSNGQSAVSIRSYQRSFQALLKKLSIPHQGFHALRHTFATRAVECGMDVKTLSEILGHKNVSVTLNRYVHSLSEHKQAMMNKVGRLLQ